MSAINLIWILPSYFFIYLSLSFVFSTYVKKVSESKWGMATTLNVIAELIFFFSTIAASTFLDVEGVNSIVMILLVGLMAAAGNGIGTLLVGWNIDRIKNKDKIKSEVIEVQ